MSQQARADRMVGVLLLSSMIAGLIAGVGARIVMRIVALTAHIPLQFTLATLNVVFWDSLLGSSPAASTHLLLLHSAVLRRPESIFLVPFGEASFSECSFLRFSDSQVSWGLRLLAMISTLEYLSSTGACSQHYLSSMASRWEPLKKSLIAIFLANQYFSRQKQQVPQRKKKSRQSSPLDTLS